jgi:hypothetical protein
MSSRSKGRQTMAKVARERAVKERRALKAEKKELRKQAAAEGRAPDGDGDGATSDAPLGREPQA